MSILGDIEQWSDFGFRESISFNFALIIAVLVTFFLLVILRFHLQGGCCSLHPLVLWLPPSAIAVFAVSLGKNAESDPPPTKHAAIVSRPATTVATKITALHERDLVVASKPLVPVGKQFWEVSSER